MPRFLRLWLSLAVVCAAAGVSLSWRPEAPAGARVLAAEGQLRWYKGNLHTHSLWSDGDDYPEMIGLWYRNHGYQFLAYTDHNVLQVADRWTSVADNKGKQVAYDKLKKQFPDWIEERMTEGKLEVRLRKFAELSEKLSIPNEFLLIQGEEISDRFGKFPIHLCTSNLKEVIPPLGGETATDVIQRNVNAVLAQRERTGQPMMIHLNHPNFNFGVTAEDLAPVRGEKFFEVYNGHPSVYNEGTEIHSSTDRIWDVVLTKRLAELHLPVMYGLGTDDGHNYHNIPSRGSEPGRGWVMVLASDLKPASLIESMEAGRFYASSGVSLSRVTASDAGLDVEVQAERGVDYTIEFLGTRKGYDPTNVEVLDKDGKPVRATRRYSPDIGQVFKTVKGTTGSYRFGGDEYYVRARVTSTKKHPNPSAVGEFERAWCQPQVGPATPKS